MPVESSAQSLSDLAISASRVAELRERFLDLNKQRLMRSRTSLQDHQRILLDLLPLLFHVNHPILPGYVNASAPCGIDGYTPDDATLTRVHQHIARSFDYPCQEPRQPQIHSLFLMGSCGSIAQSDSSDLDAWLCHSADLSEPELTLLRKKAWAITCWAESLGLELHFFLMDCEQFRRGKRDRLDADAAGTSQHFLLLDEFYRSALLLAGRYPIWWLVPPEAEEHYEEYTAQLRAEGLVRDNESIDFGGVAHIPAGEFIGAGVWQLYKAISSPYKAVLKLLLTEAYARNFPNVDPISIGFKREVHLGESDIDKLDPYILIYRRLESYLSDRQERDRLELVRRAFYFKTGLRLSLSTSMKHQQRRLLLEQLTSQWHWQPEHLLNLDTRHRWKLRRVRDEHRFLVAELTNSYRFLQEFAEQSQQKALINSEELTLLGRKLYAAFERKRNKIEWLNPGIAPDLSEQQLYFHTLGFGEQRRWVVSASARHDFEADAILQEDSQLSALLCWCFCNGLVKDNSRLRLSGRREGISEEDLNHMAQRLRSHLPSHVPAGDPRQHEAFAQPKVPLSTLFFLNLGQDPLSQLNSHGITQHRSNYPVTSVEMVCINSWGEVIAQSFNGEDTLLDTLNAYQQLTVAAGKAPQNIDVICFNDPKGQLVTRIEELTLGINRCFTNTQTPPRYVIKLSSGFHILQVRDDELDVVRADSYSSLVECLERGQERFSPIVLDPYCVPDSALASIVENSHGEDCHLFYHTRDGWIDLFVRDERGSLSYRSSPCSNPDRFLAQLLLFLLHCRQEQGNTHQFHLYELRQHRGRWVSHPLNPPKVSGSTLYIEAHAVERENGQASFDFRWNHQWIRHSDEGPKLMQRLQQQLRERYPHHDYFRIDRISLGEGQYEQSAVYLRYKHYLETLLNKEY